MKYKKAAFSFSLILLLLWGCLGTGTTLAWFVDEDNELKNVFHFAEFDLVVSHRLDNGIWEVIEEGTTIFDDEALYEPGYVQVVYLKVENRGSVPFLFNTAVNATNRAVAMNYFGQPFLLQDYLRFGMTVEDTEAEMDEAVANRDIAYALADTPLANYHETGEALLGPHETKYIAVVVSMPEEVDNRANYRLTEEYKDIPTVELGVIVRANQVGAE